MTVLLKLYKNFTGWYNRWIFEPQIYLFFAFLMYASMSVFGIYGISIGGIFCWLFLTAIIFMKELETKDPIYINKQKRIKKENYYKKYGDNMEEEW